MDPSFKLQSAVHAMNPFSHTVTATYNNFGSVGMDMIIIYEKNTLLTFIVKYCHIQLFHTFAIIIHCGVSNLERNT